jgi:hypothetical protein
LADAGKSREVVSISSVSGGSLTNGYIAQAGSYPAMCAEEFWAVLQPFVDRIAKKGTLWGSWFTWCYLLVLIILFAVFLGAFWLPVRCSLQCLAFTVGLVIWAKCLFERRGAICARAFGATLFTSDGKRTLLRDIARKEIDHVICATDLHAGEHVYFSGRFVCSYRFGWGCPGNLPLDQAVQASASFPIGFPCRWIRTARHEFVKGNQQSSLMALIDGGVYDNMAEQWAIGMGARKQRWKDFAQQFHDVEELIVVNASVGMGFQPVTKLGIPLLGELFTLLRVIDVMYDNTTSPRRQMLVDLFDKSARDGNGLQGALITIEQSPFKIADYFLQNASEWPDRAVRARAIIGILGDASRTEWSAIVARNICIRTTLRSLGQDTSARLLRHAYVTAMANLHVILGYPLLDVPTVAKFSNYVAG